MPKAREKSTSSRAGSNRQSKASPCGENRQQRNTHGVPQLAAAFVIPRFPF
jgi:hypothetical protein